MQCCWQSKKHIVCLFVCFESHEQFFSYLTTVTTTGDRAPNLDLCLALTPFSSEGSFTCHAYCDTGPPFLRSYPEDPWFYLLNAVLFAKEQSLPILIVLGFTRPARAGLELTTICLLSESTTTRLRQPVKILFMYLRIYDKETGHTAVVTKQQGMFIFSWHLISRPVYPRIRVHSFNSPTSKSFYCFETDHPLVFRHLNS
jgi:hypothetical protein